MSIYFTSDTHFGHKLMARLRGYVPTYAPGDEPDSSQMKGIMSESIEEMNDNLVHNWNSVVKPGDTVYHLGDFAFLPSDAIQKILIRLNGQKFIFRGNHDKELDRAVKDVGSRGRIVWYGDYKRIKIAGQDIVLGHYPFFVWDKSHYGSWNLHGHCHGSLPLDRTKRQMDVGVDSVSRHGFDRLTPVSFEQVEFVMKERIFVPVDRHGDSSAGVY